MWWSVIVRGDDVALLYHLTQISYYYRALVLTHHNNTFRLLNLSTPRSKPIYLPNHHPYTPLLPPSPTQPPQETILGEIELHSKRAGLHGFEIPKAVYLESEAFSGANDLLTPTQKLKRMQARDRYAATIQELYAKRDLQHAQQARL